MTEKRFLIREDEFLNRDSSGFEYEPSSRSGKKRSADHHDYFTILPDGADSQSLPTWKTYLYQLQNEAPKPRKMMCTREFSNKPSFYGSENHGIITREDAEEILLRGGEGSFLVRKSDRAPDAFTLAIRFDSQTKNFKLYYDGLHYVGEKRFETVELLVADGLIHFYLESRAADYIASLSDESNYAQSPYLAYSIKKKRLQKSRKHFDVLPPPPDFDEDKVDNRVSSPDQEDELEDMEMDVSEFEKPHNFKTHNFIGLHWCDFCANFMWGLIAQGSKCQDCGFEAHKKCSEKVPNDCMPDIKFLKRIFGADLTTIMKAHNTPRPIVVEKCIKEIELRGMNQEGLYRVAGLHDEVEEIRMSFDKDGDSTDISAARYDDINTITSVLKLYFRLLPLPLVTFDAYKKFLEAMRKDSYQEKLALVKEGLNVLLPAHHKVLKYLLGHLVKVTEKRSKTMMGSENLAIVFAPTLMRSPESNPVASLMAVGTEQKSVEFIISNFRELFGK